ncbi:unnamed protein product [Mortierella alpina]
MARTSSRIAAVRGVTAPAQDPSPKVKAASRAVTRSRRANGPTRQQGPYASSSSGSRRAPPSDLAGQSVPNCRRPTRAEKVSINFRIGEPHTHTRLRQHLPAPEQWDYKWEEHEILCIRIQRRVASIPGVEWSSPDVPYLQPKNAAPFLQFLPLQDSTCDFKLRRAWQREAKRVRSSSNVCLNVYVYLRETTRDRSVTAPVIHSADGRPQPGATTAPVRRATQARIVESRARIGREVNAGHMDSLGPMRSSHLAVHYARQGMPRDDQRLEIPRTNTFNQMQHLDRQVDELRERNEDTAAVREAAYWTVEMKMGPNVFKVEVKVEDVREMLGLPDMNLNGLRNFREDELNNPQEDMNDDEHEDDYLFHARRARQ